MCSSQSANILRVWGWRWECESGLYKWCFFHIVRFLLLRIYDFPLGVFVNSHRAHPTSVLYARDKESIVRSSHATRVARWWVLRCLPVHSNPAGSTYVSILCEEVEWKADVSIPTTPAPSSSTIVNEETSLYRRDRLYKDLRAIGQGIRLPCEKALQD